MPNTGTNSSNCSEKEHFVAISHLWVDRNTTPALFNGPEWCPWGGDYEGFYARPSKNGLLQIPSARISDVVSKRKFITSHADANGNTSSSTHYRFSGRVLITQSLTLAFCQRWRALKIGNRYYLSENTGPLPACEALRHIINVKQKRADHADVLMPKPLLRALAEEISNICQSGGYVTLDLSVRMAGEGWYAVRNITLFGPASKVERHKERVASSREYQKVRMNRRDVVQLFAAKPMGTTRRVTKTCPTKWNTSDGLPRLPPGRYLYIPCHTKGHELNSHEPEIDVVDRYHDFLVERPFHGKTFETVHSLKPKSICSRAMLLQSSPSDVEQAPNPVVSREQSPVIDPSGFYSVLGGTFLNHDESQYVRLIPKQRRCINGMFARSKMLPHFYTEKSVGRHRAGWKGSYSVYCHRFSVSIDGTWYWLDTLDSMHGKSPNWKVPVRYLRLTEGSPILMADVTAVPTAT